MRAAPDPHHRHRFPATIIAHAVWLYHAFTLSFRDVELLLAERGVRREGWGWRQVPPRATGADEIEWRIQKLPHVGGARPPAGPGWWDQRFEQAVLREAARAR